MLVSAIFLLLGAAWNSFNLLATVGWQWPLQPASLIVCLISSVNALLAGTTLALQSAQVSGGVFHHPRLPLYVRVLMAAWLGTNAVSFWAVAWLSALYCVTVVRSSSLLLLAVKRKADLAVRAGLALTLVCSYLVFLPFLGLWKRHDPCSTSSDPTPLNATGAAWGHPGNDLGDPTENATCVSSVIVFPAWVNVDAYVVFFICYLLLLPLCTMVPTSLRLVVYLWSHALSVRAHGGGLGGPNSYLLVCGLTAALVAVFVSTLVTVSVFYLHSTFQSPLSGDVLFHALSYYCLASAALLSASNRPLRERLRTLLCRSHAPPGAVCAVV